MRVALRASVLGVVTATALSAAAAQTPDVFQTPTPEASPGPAPAASPEPAPDLLVRPRVVRRHAASRKVVRRKGQRPRAAARSRVAKPVHVDQLKEAEKQGFRKVNDLLPAFPPFYPSLGIVAVDPKTLPMGPFRCFDRAGNLVASVYMPTMADMEAHKSWDKVPGVAAPVDHVTQYFHPGHPGVAMPHYHVVLWHVKNETVVAK